jgi:hypothetical protein
MIILKSYNGGLNGGLRLTKWEDTRTLGAEQECGTHAHAHAHTNIYTKTRTIFTLGASTADSASLQGKTHSHYGCGGQECGGNTHTCTHIYTETPIISTSAGASNAGSASLSDSIFKVVKSAQVHILLVHILILRPLGRKGRKCNES